ncbi:hypothetical protein N7516_009023 [Penicillium verrucosum]|uniref:uncharacterized protein n=1 Tax=Penicillium verrucosum TaxID=60171 RepID=UPI0025453220|nr:uncharacterized protein N7516_009023 [Penicillium verrucosum]KAJ5927250.1 hypothetical protein N7516_009023 [Penicillium verrucosum]
MSPRPDAISLSDILQYRRELLVNPLFWTSCHLDALGCSFQHIDNFSTKDIYNHYEAPPQRNDNQTSSAKSRTRVSDAEMLAKSAVPSVKYNILCRFLLHDGSGFNMRSKGPEFFFAGQPVHRPRYTVFHRRNQPNQFNPDAQPLIGYLDYLDVTGLRAKRLKPRTRRDKGHDTVGARIFTKKLSRVTPAEWTEDRYFLCVLLSIAQLQERLSKDSSTPSFLSRLLVVNRDDDDFIYLYEGQFACEFLKMLDKPTAATNCTNFPTIHLRKIPFQPFETFGERILAEILATNFLSIRLAVSDNVNTVNQAVKRPRQHEGGERRNVRQKS